ncbi:hypothetical protein ABIE44_003693 [Marmoricola sp. OAE513]|uniref:copper transporter n=1 Tax=Marmoricola sp. OAE513 TaxID=2817894 RepID=UPI001AEAE07D
MRARALAAAAAVVLVALGVVLGAGPLQDDAPRTDDRAQEGYDERLRDLRDARSFSDAYAGTTASRVLAGTLTGRKVALVVLPGASFDTADLLRGLVRAAGGEVSAEVGLTATLLSSGSTGLVDALTSQLAAQTPGLVAPADASTYQRFGALLARGIAVPPASRSVGGLYDGPALGVMSGFEAAKLVEGVKVGARAGLTLVLLPDQTDPDAYEALTAALTTYAAQIPTVVAGPAGSAGLNGLLGALRAADGRYSTVDSVESAAGRVAAILAIAARTRGDVGDFGAVGDVDDAVPPLS